MKRISLKASFTVASLAILLAFSCIAYIVHAENLTPQQRFLQLQTKPTPTSTAPVKQARTTALTKTQKEQLYRKIKLNARTQQRITDLAANVSNRIDAVINRLANIGQRLQSRLDLEKKQGVETATSQQLLTAAMNHLTTASSTVADIDARIAIVVATSTPQYAWHQTREHYLTARTEITAAHKAMEAALTELKKAIAAPQTGTSTKSN